jgi:hypothetical protein
MDKSDFQDLKDMIGDAKRAMDAPEGLTEIQEVSAAIFFALGIYIDDLADRVARLEDATNKPLIIGA